MNSYCKPVADSERNMGRRPRMVLRADAGRGIGFGHFIRTLALAAYLRDDFDCVVASRNPDRDGLSDYQLAEAEKAGAGVLDLPFRERDEFDSRFLNILFPEDIVVLDNYYYDSAYQDAVRSRCRRLVCIDDVHDRHFTADAVMTFLPLSRVLFSLAPHTQFYSGIEWSFLREPFLAPVCRRRGDEGNPLRIVMALGGADPFGLTDKMLGVIAEVLPDAMIDVIAGDTVQVSAEGMPSVKVYRRVSAEGVRALLDVADMGVFPASTVCVEAFSRLLPVAAGHFVDNQEEFYAEGVRRGWFAPLGSLHDSTDLLAERIRHAVESLPERKVPEFDFQKGRRRIIDFFRNL